ncbi:hypothetical protein PIB30_063129 [Stylosanthes scabra]|uniref:RNase H type-1 domain-containing protein n=1 Tax=Stylosanthes scabra TaxID=79078 RepID=A0ABU6XMQ9_9FABA|nr:hypothetical protein [Stylosanthes scabra]
MPYFCVLGPKQHGSELSVNAHQQKTMSNALEERNQAIFHHNKPSPISTIIRAQLMENQFITANHQQHNKTQKEANLSKFKKKITWRPPPRDWVKVNIDASFRSGSSLGAITAVFRDCSGRLLTRIASRIRTWSPLAAEAEAIRTALIAIKNLNIDQAIIESDNLQRFRGADSHGLQGKVTNWQTSWQNWQQRTTWAQIGRRRRRHK